MITATFYGFAPRLVAGAIPAAWDAVAPPAALALTHDAMATLLGGLLADLDDEVARATELARQAALLHPTLGRPLGAAWASVPWHDDPVVALWQAATRIRESRGDGHVALLVAHDLDGVASHLTLAGDSPKLRERMGPLRGWTDPEWDAGVDRLQARGLLADDGTLTPDGVALRQHLEDATDDLAAAPGRRSAPTLQTTCSPRWPRWSTASRQPRSCRASSCDGPAAPSPEPDLHATITTPYRRRAGHTPRARPDRNPPSTAAASVPR